MFITSLTILVTLIAVFSPSLFGLYIRWAAEPTAPAWFHNRPYAIPMWGGIIAISLAFAFFVYASIREYLKKRSVEQEQISAIIELEKVKVQVGNRLDSLERRLPNEEQTKRKSPTKSK